MPEVNDNHETHEEPDEGYAECAFCETQIDVDTEPRFVHYQSGDLPNATGARRWLEQSDLLEVCDSCFYECGDCEGLFTASRYNSDTERCHSCEGEYYECYECQSDVHTDNAYNDSNDNSFCYSCWQDHEENEYSSSSRTRYILSYSARPEAVFGFVVESTLVRQGYLARDHANDLFMGYELETNHRDRSHSLNDIAKYLLDSAPDQYLYNKEDGSISGFEIVTHPCTLEAHKIMLPRDAYRELGRTYGLSSWSSVNGTGAGLHVHVSKRSFSAPSHKYKFQLFHYRNKEQIKKFAGRDSSRWATFERGAYDNMVEIAKNDSAHQDSRYSALNFQNRDTVELRYFRGSLNPETVLGVLEFVHSVHAYTKLLTAKEVATSGLEWGRYKLWLSEQSYEFLPNVMTTRCV